MRDEPQRVSLPRSAWVALAIGGTLMLGLLGLQVALIEDQRSTVDAQLRTAVRQANRAIPLMEQVRPLADDARRARPAIRRLGRDTSVLLRDLRSADPETAAEAVRRLASEVLRSDLPGAMDDIARVTAELTAQDRLRRLLVRGTAVLGEVRERDLVAKATEAAERAPSIERLLRRSMRIQAQTLAIQRETLRVVQETRDIARNTERHAASLDRKLGGETAPAAASRGR